MNPILIATLSATLLGAGIGEWQRRRLTTLHYRHDSETPDSWPLPGPRHWLPPALAISLATLVWRYTTTNRPDDLLYLLPVALAGTWLAAVDADVHRLPYPTTLVATLSASAGIIAAAALQTNPTPVLAAAIGWAITYAVFWALHTLGRGSIGYGNIRLSALISLTTAPLSPYAPITALGVGTLAAAIWALTHHHDPHQRHAYGPWLLGGWLAAALIF